MDILFSQYHCLCSCLDYTHIVATRANNVKAYIVVLGFIYRIRHMKIKELELEQRPREKALRQGLASLNDEELLCLLLQSGNRNQSVDDIAHQLFLASGGLANLFSMKPSQLMAVPGIREVKALMLMASFELCRRVLKAELFRKQILNVHDVADFLTFTYGLADQERVVALYLDTKGHLLHVQELFVGTLNESTVHPREVFRQALNVSANTVLLAHNHPSGDARPSQADLDFTSRLIAVGQTMGIPLMDHVIVSRKKIYSLLKEARYLWEEILV